MQKQVKKVRSDFFSLIELLVVTVIISLLAGMMLPVLNKVRQKAQCASCTGQIKQLVTANAMYMGDFDDYIYPFAVSSSCQQWPRALEPYLTQGKVTSDPFAFSSKQTAKLFLCPDDSHTKTGKMEYTGYAKCTEENRCNGLTTQQQSYGINFYFAIQSGSSYKIGKKINDMTLADSKRKSGGGTIYLSEVKWGMDHSKISSLNNMDLPRHGKRNNIAFLDGSVKAYSTISWIPHQGRTDGYLYWNKDSFYKMFLQK